jgi:hypothetical protein
MVTSWYCNFNYWLFAVRRREQEISTMLLINALKYGSAVVGEEREAKYIKHGNNNSNSVQYL